MLVRTGPDSLSLFSSEGGGLWSLCKLGGAVGSAAMGPLSFIRMAVATADDLAGGMELLAAVVIGVPELSPRMIIASTDAFNLEASGTSLSIGSNCAAN